MHQGSGLSPLPFMIFMETLSRELRVALLWKLLYADELFVTDEIEDNQIKRLSKWNDNVENRGTKYRQQSLDGF